MEVFISFVFASAFQMHVLAVHERFILTRTWTECMSGIQTMQSRSNVNGDWNLPVPQEIFRRDRFLLLKLLAERGEIEFTSLRDTLGMTDGNLASHLRALENLRYIEFKKEFVGRRTRTVYRLTPVGLTNFQTLIHYLKESVLSVKIKNEYMPAR